MLTSTRRKNDSFRREATMREMLFRGKRTDNDEWVKGFYCVFNNKKHLIYTGYAEVDCGDYYPDAFEVDPSTVGQYTGLSDICGKKIFEGDIVKRNRLGGVYRYQVCYDEGLTSFIGLRGIGYTRFTYDLDEFEIIGNVYDNPELLKGDE